MLVAHVSDTHLGFRQYNLDEREEDIYRLFDEVVEKILVEKPDVVVHTGDLFDQPRPPIQALRVAYQGFRRLRERGVKVYCILGDHDVPKRRSEPPHLLLRELGVVDVVGVNPFREDPFRVVGGVFIVGVRSLPKKYSPQLVSLLNALARRAREHDRAILMLHQGIREHFPYSYELELQHLPEGFNYYALGHIHMRKWFYLHDGVVGYAGSIDVIRIDEWEEYLKNGKGFYLVDLSRKEPVIHRVDLEGIREHIVLEIDYNLVEQKIKELAKRVMNTKLKPVLHLTVRGRRIDKSHVQRLLLRMLQGKVLTWRLRFEEEKTRPSSIREERISIEELLKQMLGDEEVAELALKLLEPLSRGDVSSAVKITEEYYKSLTK